jgi:hypothetical protein
MICKIFAHLEDELFQQLTIMGMCLRRIKSTHNQTDTRKYAVIGTEAASKVDRILENMRTKNSKQCNTNNNSHTDVNQ